MKYFTFNSFGRKTDSIEKRGLKPIKTLIRFVGGWPLVEGNNWTENAWKWQEVLLKLELKGFDMSQIFSWSVDSDMKNSSRRNLQVKVIMRKLIKFSDFRLHRLPNPNWD